MVDKVDPLTRQQEFNEDLNFEDDAPSSAVGCNDELMSITDKKWGKGSVKMMNKKRCRIIA